MKTPIKVISRWFTFLLCLLAASVLAQTKDFKYRAALPKVDTAGYYRINLQPALAARAKEDLSDIRILNSHKQFVPYVKVGDFPPDAPARKLIVFSQVKTIGNTDSSSVFVVENPTGSVTDNLTVWLKNTLARRSVSIAGSDDLKQWFAITEQAGLGTASALDKSGEFQQDLSFPPVSYRYLKLTIINGRNAPLHILRAGIYTWLPVTPNFVGIPLKFKQVDTTARITHLYIDFDQAYTINKLTLSVNLKQYFRREVNIYVNNKDHEWLTTTWWGNANLNINLAVRAKSLDVQIVNNDDLPLPATKVEAYQSENFVVAKLEPDQAYYVLTGAPHAAAPKYDLQFFAEKIGEQLPGLHPMAVEVNPAYRNAATGTARAGKPYLLWAAIALAVLILSVLTFSMTKEVKKRETI